MDEQRKAKLDRLLGSPERRIAARDIEVRAGTGSTFLVRGYASVADHPYDVYGGASRGGWSETVMRGAFDTTLAAGPDVSFLLNHEGAPLARTRGGKGTLTLRADTTGLEAEAEVDRRDPEGASLEVKMERGDLDQMSFGFRVTRQSWNEDYTERDIQEVNLDHGDVSVVNVPANPATSMNIVSARSALAVLGEMQLAELRADLGDISADELREAHMRLGELVAAMMPTTELVPAPASTAGTVNVDVVPVLRETTREGLATVARQLLGALLDDEDEARIEALVAGLRTLSAPVVINEPPVEPEVDPEVVETVAERDPSRSVRSIARYRAVHGL